MGLFKADLYRSFAIGFGLGAAALVALMGINGHPAQGVIAQAQAAPAVVDQTR